MAARKVSRHQPAKTVKQRQKQRETQRKPRMRQTKLAFQKDLPQTPHRQLSSDEVRCEDSRVERIPCPSSSVLDTVVTTSNQLKRNAYSNASPFEVLGHGNSNTRIED